MDRSGASFTRCVDMISKRLNSRPLPVQIPIGSEDNFKGMIDLVEMKALVWDSDDKDAQWAVLDVTADLADTLGITVPTDRAILARVFEYRKELVDTCLEMDDVAMEAYLLEEKDPTVETLRACLRKGTVTGVFNPVLCGSSYKNKGVQQVLDAVVDYLPAPTDVAAINTVDADGNPIGERLCSDDEPFSALAFKVINDAYGALTFVRVYSGVLAKGMSVTNTTRGKREKIGRMVEMFAKEANPIEEARAGDIIALVSLAETDTGDTLCDTDHPVVLERMRFPEPVISVSVQPKVKGELEKAKARGVENPLDAGVMLPTSHHHLEDFVADLPDLFGVSRVVMAKDQSSIEVVDLRGEPRCERSWKRDGTVRQRSDGGTLSDRDAEALGIA
jgi:elongation factor G